MRLFPPELDIGLDEGFTQDKDIFKRSEFGARLSTIVRVLDGPAVLVLDAPWGTGKTSFVRMWRGSLNREGVPTIYFDAFANDYHEDAFLALAAEIIARAEEVEPRSSRAVRSFKSKAVKVAKVLGRASLHVGVRLGTAGILAASDVEEVVAVGKEAAKEIGKEAADALDQLVKERLESHRTDPFEEGRLSRAVLADDDGDRLFEGEREVRTEQRQAKGIGLGVGDKRLVEPDALQIGRGQVDGTLSSAHVRARLI
jgi:hypothetical protein